jgi:hypothetical protein
MNIFTKSRNPLIFSALVLALLLQGPHAFGMSENGAWAFLEPASNGIDAAAVADAARNATPDNQSASAQSSPAVASSFIPSPITPCSSPDIINSPGQFLASSTPQVQFSPTDAPSRSDTLPRQDQSLPKNNRLTHLKIAAMKAALCAFTYLPTRWCYQKHATATTNGRKGWFALLTLACGASIAAIGYDAAKSCWRAYKNESIETTKKDKDGALPIKELLINDIMKGRSTAAGYMAPAFFTIGTIFSGIFNGISYGAHQALRGVENYGPPMLGAIKSGAESAWNAAKGLWK